MANSQALVTEYRELLEHHGLSLRRLADPDGAEARAFLERFRLRIPSAPPDVLADLKTAIDGRGLQSVIDEHATVIERAMASAGLTLAVDVWAAEFPTGSFNAQARSARHGVLLLMNTGLMMFLHETTKVMSLAVATATLDETGEPVDGSIGNTSGFSRSQIVDFFATLVTAYLRQGDVTAAGPMPTVFDGREMFGALVTQGAEEFVLAHEYGHAIAGHLNRPRTVVASTPVGDVQLIAKGWQDEFDADHIAFRLVTGSPLPVQTEEDLIAVQLKVTGVMWFFAMEQLITAAVERLAGKVTALCDHPASHLRMAALYSSVPEAERVVVFEVAKQILQWSQGIFSDIVDEVKQRFL